MDAKRATRNLAGINSKCYRIWASMDQIARARPDLWQLTPVGRVKQRALAKRLGRLGERLKELVGAVEETERLIREE